MAVDKHHAGVVNLELDGGGTLRGDPEFRKSSFPFLDSSDVLRTALLDKHEIDSPEEVRVVKKDIILQSSDFFGEESHPHFYLEKSYFWDLEGLPMRSWSS